MKNIKQGILFFSVIGLFMLNACSYNESTPAPSGNTDTTDTTDTTTVVIITYDDDAKVILNNCTTSGCHTTGASIGSMSGYTDAKTFAGFGRILGALNHESGFSAMPKNSMKLSDENIKVIKDWITDGLLEN